MKVLAQESSLLGKMVSAAKESTPRSSQTSRARSSAKALKVSYSSLKCLPIFEAKGSCAASVKDSFAIFLGRAVIE